MRKLSSIVLFLALLVSPALAAQTGDPIDGNDRTMSSVDEACEWYINYPSCNWCWQVCFYAMIQEDYLSGGITWQWGD